MNPNGDLLSRCPKHPSQPPFTGFCSACLLERLSAASLPSPSPCSAPAPAAVSEITAETQTCTRLANPRPARTTLLYLFQLDDMANGSTSAVHQQRELSQSLPSQGGGGQGDPPLQRKRSLRQPCDWIVCCDAANESWDGSAGAAPQLVLDRRRNKASLSSWNQVWEPLRGFVNKPAHILLRRSLSESWSINGSRPPVSSAGRMDSEISSLAEDSAIHADAGRDSLMKRLYWLGRGSSRSQGRRLSLFATPRHQQQ